MGRSTNRVFKKRKAFHFDGPKKSIERIPVNNNVINSASARKLSSCNDFETLKDTQTSANIIIELELLSQAFENVSCKICGKQTVKIMLKGKDCGLSVKLHMYCENCEFKHDFNTSSLHKTANGEEFYALNTRLVYSFRAIGKGASAAQVFCGLMNLPPPPSKFGNYNAILKSAAEDVCTISMSKAAKEAIAENIDENSAQPQCATTNIAVAVDGTWQKRNGYSSKNGVVSATSVDTGKVLDIEILSKHCVCPDKRHHDDDCKKNFDGSSGNMEVVGALAIFKRSEKLHSLRYVKYLGDGDSKAFSNLEKENVYGDKFPVEKLECIGHIQKRMGCRLRRLVKKMKGEKLCDNKVLGGRGRLTDSQIDKLQTYYGLAIRRNTGNLEDMRQAVWAVFLHKYSTDDKPQHGFCPPGAESWCRYQKSLVSGASYQHKDSLPEAVMELIRPIFRDLSHPDLLRKCLHGKTQNSNESLNNIIWSRLPKSIFVQIETLKFGVYDAVSVFNDGNIVRCQVFDKLNLPPGKFCVSALQSIDNYRLRKAERDCLESTKESRIKKRNVLLGQEPDSDDDYCPGGY